jgi:hypothetical protein
LQVIYLAPFVLLSAILGVIFLMVPRLRRHAVSAAVVPVAFAVSSITGVFATVLIAEHFGFDRAFGFDAPAHSLGRIATFFSIYTVLGILGAILAVLIVNRIRRCIFRGPRGRLRGCC